MQSKQNTGMRGVFLVAAELSRFGYIVSPTSRSAYGADLLVTNRDCSKAYSVQVKTNARTFSHWLLNKNSKEMYSRSHIYVFVNLRKRGNLIEYFVIPSKIVSNKMKIQERPKNTWYWISYEDAKSYENNWKIFG